MPVYSYYDGGYDRASYIRKADARQKRKNRAREKAARQSRRRNRREVKEWRIT